MRKGTGNPINQSTKNEPKKVNYLEVSNEMLDVQINTHPMPNKT
jgi:hypothetical protein